MDAIPHSTGLAGLIETTLIGVHKVGNVPTLATSLAQTDLLLLLLLHLLHLLGVLHELLVMLHTRHSGAGSCHRGSRGGVRGRQLAILRIALFLSAHAVALPTIRAGREKVLAICLLKERRLLSLSTPTAPVSAAATVIIRWRATTQLAILQVVLYLLQVLRWRWWRRLRAHHGIVLLWRRVMRVLVLVVVVVAFARWRLSV